ncbi:MAG: DNA-processing protein DprA, partial [Candidatus Gracilibacteria bacterium]|nr:DNA-processing protein DprA [Candidatus Gracilibacteria bacterium]
IESLNLQILTLKDPDYPELLRQIYDAPLVLYLNGNIELLRCKKIAIVGTRKYSSYGAELTRKLVTDLTQANLTIVSGLARGIDQIAHQAALDQGGKTIAVLGSAVDQIYPVMNRRLARKMVESGRGLILSEFPLGMKPEKYTFPMRNRIISGLSLATLVTEAGEKSGALITAKMAADQGREVFAVPGNILHSGSHGTHELIKSGAKLVTCAQDILEELSLAYQSARLPELKFENPLEERIYNLLLLESLYGDQIKKELGINIELLNSTLTMMELKGYIRNLGDKSYVAN